MDEPPLPPPDGGGIEVMDPLQNHHQQQRRRQYKHIPEPTWSIKDLDLFTNQPPLPKEELERLCRLALIDISRKTMDEQTKLNQDLANMLHMIQQVTEYCTSDDELDHTLTTAGHRDGDVDTTTSCSSEIYDFVRGVTAAPLRKGIDMDPLHDDDAKQAQEVWDNLLQPKTIRKGGGHQYFAIVTEEAKSTK
jgi:Asp-tRNA(Asn)/Glu-tRNA(Gln) amidotransferase C subunit